MRTMSSVSGGFRAGPVDDLDGETVLDRGLARRHDRGARLPLGDADLPEVPHALGGQDRHAAVEHGAHRGDVGVGAVGAAAVDLRGSCRARRASSCGTRTTRRARTSVSSQCVSASSRPARSISARRKLASHSAAWATKTAPSSARRIRSATSANGGPPRALPRRARARAPRRRSARPGERASERISTARPPTTRSTHTSTTRSFVGVEPRHLEIDERERRLGDREIPGRPGGGGGRASLVDARARSASA